MMVTELQTSETYLCTTIFVAIEINKEVNGMLACSFWKSVYAILSLAANKKLFYSFKNYNI